MGDVKVLVAKELCVPREAHERNVVLAARVATWTAADYFGAPFLKVYA